MDKREQLVEQAFRLFYRQGVYAVGINKVLDESGIAKKTLYNHFASKEALVAATVSYRDSLFRQWLFGRMDAVAAGKPAQALRRITCRFRVWPGGLRRSATSVSNCRSYF